ncbi:hypothetical protein ABEQ41_26300 [Priestia megaterium]
MKYTNGFFVFRTKKTGYSPKTKPISVTEVWNLKGCIENFHCYHYSWLIQDKDGLRCEFHDSGVWIDTNRELVVIFMSNEVLVTEVTDAIERKFNVRCEPYILKNQPTIMKDGNILMPSIGISNIFNKVKTTLLNNDRQRVVVIESILAGG